MRRLLEETEPIWREIIRELTRAAASQLGWYIGDELGRTLKSRVRPEDDEDEDEDSDG